MLETPEPSENLKTAKSTAARPCSRLRISMGRNQGSRPARAGLRRGAQSGDRAPVSFRMRRIFCAIVSMSDFSSACPPAPYLPRYRAARTTGTPPARRRVARTHCAPSRRCKLWKKISPATWPPNISSWSGLRGQSAKHGVVEVQDGLVQERHHGKRSQTHVFGRVAAVAGLLVRHVQQLAHVGPKYVGVGHRLAVRPRRTMAVIAS